MKNIFSLSLTIVILTAGLVEPLRGIEQGRNFDDPDGRFSLTLAEGWEPVVYKDGAGNTVIDLVFENRERGLLRIRRKHVDQDMTAKALAQRDENLSLRFRPGYTKGSIKPFSNQHHQGAVLSFDFTTGGRPKTARYYYLKVDQFTFYVLQFEGISQVLRTLRNRTNLMARSFRVLP